ncbi:MAG: hypothetical protein H6662_15365 [Ardenticatenaceae bacterium]|nr:hypothetical protein [Anaerolineales bacterium]MCB8922966.1 hypothetical protein [Ardenticatenaceae bacterium]MCB8990301.1 hypothetical protein [Ardenticatenaceae bacterium]
MFRKNLIMKITVVILTLLAMVTLYQTTFAGCCASQSFAGSVANARKYNITLDSIRWRAQIESAMGSWGEGPAIDTIGWTWWNVYEMCNGSVIELTARTPVAASNRAYQSRTDLPPF